MREVDPDTENSLRRAIRHDPETGKLFWSDAWHPEQLGGREIGNPDRGYVRFEHRGRRFFAHRVMWFLHFGVWPDNEIDHINGIGTDNRICNLRPATRAQNNQNRQGRQRTSVRYKGVQPRPDGRFSVWLGAKYVGTFNCPTKAALAYDKAARVGYGAYALLNLLENTPRDNQAQIPTMEIKGGAR